MSLIFDRRLTAPAVPAGVAETAKDRLNIIVVFTSMGTTTAALKKAGSLAESLGAQISLIVPQVVPFPLPLTSPPVLLDFQEKRFQEIASQCPVDVNVQLYLCRDAMETLKTVLKPHSLIVLGGRKRWWPTGEARLARKLQKAGHEVVVTEAD